ncbi:MAG: hypothetical protein ACYDHB_13740 [Candidatus Dormibacteria bacterium]
MDLTQDEDDEDERRPKAAAHPTRSARREPDDDEEAVFVATIAAATADAVTAGLKKDQHKVDQRLAEHDRRLGDLEEAKDETTAELARLEAKLEAKAAGAVPVAANGAPAAAAPAAGAREIAIVEPDLGKGNNGKEDHLPDDPNGPKQPRGGWRSIW